MFMRGMCSREGFWLKYGIRNYLRMKQRISIFFWSIGINRNVKRRLEPGQKGRLQEAPCVRCMFISEKLTCTF